MSVLEVVSNHFDLSTYQHTDHMDLWTYWPINLLTYWPINLFSYFCRYHPLPPLPTIRFEFPLSDNFPLCHICPSILLLLLGGSGHIIWETPWCLLSSFHFETAFTFININILLLGGSGHIQEMMRKTPWWFPSSFHFETAFTFINILLMGGSGHIPSKQHLLSHDEILMNIRENKRTNEN